MAALLDSGMESGRPILMERCMMTILSGMRIVFIPCGEISELGILFGDNGSITRRHQ
jgi:hypothetical protein